MNKTPNLNLNRPGPTDYVNIEDLNENADIIDGVVGDYMYQIPTIVDAQIRINRLSNTNRLFFKLEDDLTGDITISTDGGTTEKPLVDVDENPITQLEKGFVEVVADANFFILRNRGISGADKQALIDIVNEAEANESDLKTLFVNAVNDVDTDGGIDLPSNATWADILAVVPSIKTGRKWKPGYFTSVTGVSMTVDLDFTPSIVILSTVDVNYNGASVRIGDFFNTAGGASFRFSPSGGSKIVNGADIKLLSNGFTVEGFNSSWVGNTIVGSIYWLALE